MTKENLSIVSMTLDYVEDLIKNYRSSVSDYYFEPRFIRLTVKSHSAGLFDEFLGVSVPERLATRIMSILDGVFTLFSGVSVDVALFHLDDSLPCIPTVDISVFKEDVLDYCRRHH